MRSQLASIFLTLVFLILGAAFLYHHRLEMGVLAQIGFRDLLLVSTLTALSFAVAGYTFSLLVGMASVHLSILEMVGLSLITNFGNYLGPARPGAAVKAMYLKGKKGLSYTRFSSVAAANVFLVFLVSGFAGLVSLILAWLESGHFSLLLATLCFALMSAAALPFLLPLPSLRHRLGIVRLVNEAVNAFHDIRVQTGQVIAVCGSIFAQNVLLALIYQAVYASLDQEIPFLSAFMMGVFVSTANIIALTPNNLGFQEVVTAYLYSVTGLDFTTGLIGAALFRAVHGVLTFALAPPFAYHLLGRSGLTLAVLRPGIWRRETDAEETPVPPLPPADPHPPL